MEDAGFYAEFLTPLAGAEFTRRGKRDVTVRRAGITAQKLRHLGILLLYIHGTLEFFGGALEDLRTVWRDDVRPSMSDKTARHAEARARALFETVTDDIRQAARIPQPRRLSPENLRAAGEYGLEQILSG